MRPEVGFVAGRHARLLRQMTAGVAAHMSPVGEAVDPHEERIAQGYVLVYLRSGWLGEARRIRDHLGYLAPDNVVLPPEPGIVLRVTRPSRRLPALVAADDVAAHQALDVG